MKPDSDDSSPVRVEPRSLVGQQAEWFSRRVQAPVAIIAVPGRSVLRFTENQVLVSRDDRELIDELVGRYRAQLIEPRPIPESPREFRQRELHGKAPEIVQLRFASPPGDPRLDMLHSLASDRLGRSDVIVSSAMGAGVADLVATFGRSHAIALNHYGAPDAMPLSSPAEGAGVATFSLLHFIATHMPEAWQLTDSVRLVRGDRFTSVGILDIGFWLDAVGQPVQPGGMPSDIGNGVMSLNLMNNAVTPGGAAPTGSPWHGNSVASVATAALGNGISSAGSGGSVAFRMLFQTSMDAEQVLFAVRTCAAWGVDVLNMSFGIDPDWLAGFFWEHPWKETFQFAANNGVVMIAAAGNDGKRLPDEKTWLPATRTPGVLTVGALGWPAMPAAATDYTVPRPDSNYGESVDLWAPGTNLPVIPNPNSPNGGMFNQTSSAAPLVSGVAAMMRFVNPTMSADDVRQQLVASAFSRGGRADRQLNAEAAVRAALGGKLPDSMEPNNSLQTASTLLPVGVNGALIPGIGEFTTRSHSGDTDYWKFTVSELSTVQIKTDWYERLSALHVSVAADVHEDDAAELVAAHSAGNVVLSGLLPADTYRIRIGNLGNNEPTAYRLQVVLKKASIERDLFEPNDSVGQAFNLQFEAPVWTPGMPFPFLYRTRGPGTFSATLHEIFELLLGGGAVKRVNDDYFRLEVPPRRGDLLPTLGVFDADEKINVTLLDASQNPIRNWANVRDIGVVHPPEGICFLRVSGSKPTRYRIQVLMMADLTDIPEWRQELEFAPGWQTNPPPFHVRDPIVEFAVDLEHQRALWLSTQSEDVKVSLLAMDGHKVAQGRVAAGQVEIDTGDAEPGRYVLRIERTGKGTPVTLRMTPPPTLL